MHQLRIYYALTLSILLTLLAACDSTESQKQAAASAPPPGVLVVKVGSEQVKETIELIGRTVAVNDVSINAQVSGYLLERLFEEGAEVEAEDLLFKIDPSIYEAQAAAARGSVAKAEAALARADKDLKRYRVLLKKQSVSQQQVDQAESDELQAKAELEAALASLEKADTDLSFTEIRAPITGRIGRALVSVGNLVGPQSGELARLVELDPIYVNFSISERDLLNVKEERLKDQSATEPKAGVLEVTLRLANKSLYDHKGRIDFIDNMVDPKTGTVTMRARFDNPDDLLVPGLYVSTILSTRETKSELLVPQQAVQEDQTGHFVMVVDPDDKIERRKISTGRQLGVNLVVTEGLVPDERVVVEGIQKVRPGMKVDAELAPLPAADREAADQERLGTGQRDAEEGKAQTGQAQGASQQGAREAVRQDGGVDSGASDPPEAETGGAAAAPADGDRNGKQE